MTTHRLTEFSAPAEGELTAVTVDDREIALALAGGRLYAFDDTCTHQQCSLADGEVEDLSVVCPCHAGTFDLATGAVLSGPPKDGVRTYPARLADGVLELDVDP